MPVTANTDPDAECAASCAGDGLVAGMCAGGVAACATAATSCGAFNCDSSANACRTTCTDNSACSASGFCNVAHACAKRLRVALETVTASNMRTQSFPFV